MTDEHGPEWYDRTWRQLVEILSREPELQDLPDGAPSWLSRQSIRRSYVIHPNVAVDLVLCTDPAQYGRIWQVKDWHEVANGLQDAIRRSPGTLEKAEQAVAEVTASPEHRELISRITAGIRRVDVAGLTPWALLVFVACLLAWFSGEPGTSVSNDIGSLAIIVAMAAIIQARK